MNVEQRRVIAARADAVIAALARLWPNCFSVLEGRRRPLAVGIHDELRRHLEPMIRAGRISARDIAIGLSRYCGSARYLARSREGADRIGLNGQPCGTVSAEHAARAKRLLDRHRRRRVARAAAIVEQGPLAADTHGGSA